MWRDVPGRKSILLVLVVISINVVLGHAAFAQKDTTAVLVVDFIGHWDEGSDHAQTFRDTVLPRASVVSIGIHGIVSDARRKGAGYDAIIRASSAKDYERSATQVSSLIKGDQTILGFDVNEGIKVGSIPVGPLPQQMRQEQPLMPNKIFGPAMVAARVAEQWLEEHPDGVLILRGHSDGTYAALYIFDYLKERGRAPAAVILESPRQAYERWAERAKQTLETLFLSITSTDDFPREGLFDRGYAHIPAANWVNMHVQGFRDPLSAHSIVTDYRTLELKIQRTGADGQTFFEHVSLGYLVTRELSNALPITGLRPLNPEPRPLDPSMVQSELPSTDERKKWLPSDPWDKGGGAGASGGGPSSQGGDGETSSPGVPGANPRGGISADIQIQPSDFRAQ